MASFRFDGKPTTVKGIPHLQLRVRFTPGDNVRWYFAVGLTVAASQWDAQQQLVNERHPQHGILNQRLLEIRAALQQLLSQKQLEKTVPTRQEIEKIVSSRKPQAPAPATGSFQEACAQFLRTTYKERKEGTYKEYSTVISDLLEWERPRRIGFGCFEEIALREFVVWLVTDPEKNNANATASKKATAVKTIAQWMLKRGYHNISSFKDYSFHYSEKVENKPYLTRNELDKMLYAKLSKPKYERVRDVFCFACYTGLRYSDIKILSRDHIKSGFYVRKDNTVAPYQYISMITVKTTNPVEIPLVKEALEILERYKDKLNPIPRYALQTMNKCLKEVAAEAKIDTPWRTVRLQGKRRTESVQPKHQLITTHCARVTFITLQEERGVPLSDIQRIVGHNKIETTMKYARSDKHKRASLMLED